MLIVADENMPLVDEYFGHLGEIRRYPGRQMCAADVREADILLVRSVTRVDQSLLQGSRVRFVGTATIGRDHIDEQWLESKGIAMASAPGCNAPAVVEYVLAALLALHAIDGIVLAGRTLGVVGLGNVGSRLVTAAEGLGLNVIACDPWLKEAACPLVSWEELSRRADFISLHVPLVEQGAYPTRHLVDAAVLARLSSAQVLINTSRGTVIDNDALLQRLSAAEAPAVILDVWEGEPGIDRELLKLVRLGTPHVAGYSQEGKWRGTHMIHEACCRFLGQENPYSQGLWPKMTFPMACGAQLALEMQLASIVLKIVPILRDDAALRQLPEPVAAGFDRLRKEYPPRYEFSAYQMQGACGRALPMLSGWGFCI